MSKLNILILDTQIKGTPYSMYSVDGSIISICFRSVGNLFELQAILREVHRMVPKMTLNTTRSKVPHICFTSVHGSQISASFALQPVVLELQAISDKCSEWPQISLNTTRSKVLESQISLHYALRPTVPSYLPFWDKCAGWPQNDVEHYKVKATPLYVTSRLWSQISVRFPLRPAISELQGILRQVDRMTPKWHWTLQLRSKVPHIYVLLVSPNQISLHFALRPAIFEIQDCWKSEISEMFRMTSDWLWNLNSQKYLVCTR